ncbi:MAG: metal ABC transporter permease, partial [Fidelibacterota bacterium]
MIELIIWPLIAAMVLTSIHVYLGLQVVRRGVIFVDLALAQVAALGSAVGILVGLDPDGILGYLLALGFTFLGATLFAFIRSADRQVPQEAIIGITYVVTAALMILVFSRSAEGAEQVNHLLVGSILFVTPEIVGYTAALYLVVGGLHWKFRRQFLQAAGVHSEEVSAGELKKLRLWDF